MKNLFIILSLLCSYGILTAQEQPIEVPQIGIKVALGETVQIDTLQIRFVEVLEDSRCPKYTDCVWAGRARIRVEISEDSSTVVQQELIFNQNKQNNISSLGGYMYYGMALTPYPSMDETGEREYVLIVGKRKN